MNDDDLMDELLTKTMSAERPTLSEDFDARVASRLRSGRLTQRAKIVLAVYFVAATATTAWLMGGLPIGAVAAGLVLSLAIAAATGAYGRHLARPR